MFWRVAIKPGRPVAMGVIGGLRPQGGAAFVGLPGNPAAAFVTFARVVRPLLLRLRAPGGSRSSRCRCAPATRRRTGGGNTCGWARARRRRPMEAIKHAQEGAGVITSLTETDELPEDVTTVEPGSTVGLLSYAALVGVRSSWQIRTPVGEEKAVSDRLL